MHYEVKSKISSALVQLTVHFLMKQNEQKRNLRDLKKKRILRTVWVNSRPITKGA